MVLSKINNTFAIETQRIKMMCPTSLQAEEALSYHMRNKDRFLETKLVDQSFTHLPDLKIHLDKMIVLKKHNLAYLLYLYRKDNSQLIGTIYIIAIEACHFKNIRLGGLSIDIACEGKGYMLEALKAVLDFNFYQLKVERIEAVYGALNIKSQKMLFKLGFKKIGHDSAYVFMDDKECGYDLLSLNIKGWKQISSF